MIKLLSLTFNNIRCFDTEQTISFVDRDKLIQVDGINKNTGGSSGAGKTSVFLALDYLFGVSDVPATILQSWLTKQPIEVRGEFLIDGRLITITRSKKSGLTIIKPDETISGNVKLAEEELDMLIGMPRKIFRKMIHKKQKEGGFFLNMTAKEIYEFLVKVLELDGHIAQTDTVSEDIIKMTKELNHVNISIQLNSASIKDLERIKNEKIKPSKLEDSEPTEELSVKLTMLANKIETIKKERQDRLNKLIEPVKPVKIFDSSNIKTIEGKVLKLSNLISDQRDNQKNLQNQLIKASSLEQELKTIGSKIVELRQQKEHIQESNCPTCRQKWTGETADNKITTIDANIDKLTKYALSQKNIIDKIPELRQAMGDSEAIEEKTRIEISSLEEQLKEEAARKNAFDSEISIEFLKAQKDFSEKQHTINLQYQEEITSNQREYDEINTKFKMKSQMLENYKRSMTAYDTEISSINTRIKEKTIELEDVGFKKHSLLKQITVAEETKRLIKAYVLQTFQETLDLISETATDILSNVPNMVSSTIYFEGCKETKSGTMKDEVNAVVNVNGMNAIPIKAFSGGERTTLDLAVDLAVIDVIETKSGKGADFFVIDEPFDGLDSICKENYLEILKQLDTNKKIILVDHSSELKEMVSDIITIVKSGESSAVA